MDLNGLVRSWPEIENLESDCLAVKEFRDELRFQVARNYGWLAGELYNLEGELGWSSGNREWDDDEEYPPPTEKSGAYMKTFLNTLKSVRKDDELVQIIQDAINNKCTDKIRKNVCKCLAPREASKSMVIQHFYDSISRRGNLYTIGAARIYRSTWVDQRQYVIALAGLVRLLFQPLKRLMVRSETVKRRLMNLTPRTFDNERFMSSHLPQEAVYSWL